MRRAWFVALMALSLALSTSACGETDDGATEGNIDPALLSEYRAALPAANALQAPTLQASGAGGGFGTLTQALVGEPATFPGVAMPVVEGVNGAVGGIIAVLDTLTGTEPTVYDSETQEFLWGPWENSDGYGWVSATMRDTGPDSGEDFRYHYALVRATGRELASAQPVIWGGANPDPNNPDFGTGVTLWDFEANAAFEEANNPTPPALDRGRFVAVYGRGPDENDATATVTLVMAAFRQFVSKDNPAATPANVDYLYGKLEASTHTVHFVDFAGDLDIDDGDGDPATSTPSAAEALSVRIAVIDQGFGRAEVMATGGDVGSNPGVDSIVAVECWDANFARSYLSLQALGPDGTEVWSLLEGAEGDCAAPFATSLTELGVPALADVPAELSAALNEVATNGLPAQ